MQAAIRSGGLYNSDPTIVAQFRESLEIFGKRPETPWPVDKAKDPLKGGTEDSPDPRPKKRKIFCVKEVAAKSLYEDAPACTFVATYNENDRASIEIVERKVSWRGGQRALKEVTVKRAHWQEVVSVLPQSEAR